MYSVGRLGKTPANERTFRRLMAKFEKIIFDVQAASPSSWKTSCMALRMVSGSDRERPQFQRMLDQIRSSDTIVVWKLDRLARSTRDLLETMEAIREAGGKFQSLSEPWADTTTHAGKMIMTIFAGIAEFERDLIRERTSAGREAARKRGVRFGRPRKLSVDQEQLARRLVLEGRSVSDIARTFNVHVATIYRLAETQ